MKNRIEFQWGSKLQGTSSEALVQVEPRQRKIQNLVGFDPVWNLPLRKQEGTKQGAGPEGSVHMCGQKNAK